MTDRALVVVTATAAHGRDSGASLRVDDVVAALQDTGHQVSTTTADKIGQCGTGWDLGVAVSYASAGCLRELRLVSSRIWLDAVDSWLLTDLSGLGAGHASYALRALRDATRVATAPHADLVTYISAADLRQDRGTVRGRARLVLPGRAHGGRAKPSTTRRLVMTGDWDYLPNRDGLRWLRRQVLPLLDASVHLYGPGDLGPGHAALVRHGYVKDRGELLQNGDVHLAPVHFGAGIKRKVLQPLLAGLPVVTTPGGAHGLRTHPLLDVEARPSSFAAAALARLAGPVDLPAAQATDLHDRDDSGAVARWLLRDKR